jgi:hypothetical protein
VSSDTPQLKIYTQEEIEIFLSGDRREVDRLLLHGINNLAVVLISHAEREEDIFMAMGSGEEVRARTIWIDAQVEKQRISNGRMQRVADSALAYALPLFLGFLALALWDSIVAALETKLGL